MARTQKVEATRPCRKQLHICVQDITHRLV